MINTLANFYKRYLRDDRIFRRVLANSGWLLSSNSVTMSLRFIQGLIIARLLGVEQFGVFGLVITYATTVNQLVDSRVWETVIKFVVEFREEGDLLKATAIVKLCYLVDAVTGTLAFLILFLTANLAAHLFIKDSAASDLIQFYAFSLLIAVPIDTSSALLRIANRFDWLAYQDVSAAILRLIGVLLVVALKGGIKEILVVYMFTSVVTTLVILVLSYKVVQQLGVTTWRRVSLSSLQDDYNRVGRFLVATNANAFLKLLRNTDTLLIGYLLTPTQVGYYRLARSMTNLMQFPIAPLYTASYPEFARLWHQQKFDGLRQLIRKLTLSSTLVAIFGLLIVWIGGEWLIRLTVGAEYLPALPVLYWLSLGITIAIATNFAHPLLIVMGRASGSAFAIMLGVTVQLILLVFLLPVLGIIAAGASFLAFYLIWSILVTSMIKDAWRKRSRLVTSESSILNAL